MEERTYTPAQIPTMYFIGVTTAKSSIMKIFPHWAEYLQLGECQLVGLDFQLHDKLINYREAVRFIKHDPLSLGALVTTHKIDLLAACKDLFEELDPYAQTMDEVSSISKRDGKLVGHAKDPISSALALEAFLPDNYWAETGAEIFLMGAGGSTIALTAYLMQARHGKNRPSNILISNRSTPRLREIERIHQELQHQMPVEYIHAPVPEKNDAVVSGLAPYSVVVNATGLGKDAPGSPLTDAAVFPEHGIAWDFNYRGELLFLDQARAQQQQRQLQIEDGWIYFLHGWTQVIAEVFHVDIPTEGPVFEELSTIAAAFQQR
ncbi:shikimate dehydrogenase [candidate division KSB3 bacterium]|uniref:Shikimate dehydrogenase n=1 Tax=candidate division KSB3 bacterium TaxID=2044937 RepID=A0A9D5JYG4_9BACT|nr:shikimate dehydrogenase [candidate division KSB3 bacterium]MBD3326271.1 shikimate dehydrogenase [candidate division KSB3 bacterium]